MEAFRNVPIHTRRQYYLTKVRRHRFDLANQTERSVALLKDLHRCAVMMVLPNGTILEADKKILVNSKVGAGWLLDGQTSSEYEDVGIEEAMRVLHIMTAGGPSMPAKVKAEVVDLTGETSGDEVIDLTMED
jgi:hypothetical protein